MAKIPWWKGTHGEWYVVGQVALIALVFFGPRNIPALTGWTDPFTWLGSIGGGVILLAGILYSPLRSSGWDRIRLPFPTPKTRGG
jgi:hypothetical protein